MDGFQHLQSWTQLFAAEKKLLVTMQQTNKRYLKVWSILSTCTNTAEVAGQAAPWAYAQYVPHISSPMERERFKGSRAKFQHSLGGLRLQFLFWNLACISQGITDWEWICFLTTNNSCQLFVLQQGLKSTVTGPRSCSVWCCTTLDMFLQGWKGTEMCFQWNFKYFKRKGRLLFSCLHCSECTKHRKQC